MEQHDVIKGKRFLLGITGSIAAYKSVDLLRRLTDEGGEVRVAMTAHAEKFVSRLTFETLSGLPVLCEESPGGERTTMGHIDVTDGLDAAIIAPATANIIGKLAAGIADDALTSACMALDCPMIIAPAMNDRMYRNPVLQRNIAQLKGHGVRIVDPGTGSLACGVTGQGRLADTELIVREVVSLFRQKDLAGRTVMVTAGPTREKIDAVRFISNPSTGKMGYAVAVAARDRGANVILVSGPTDLAPPAGVTVVPVVSAAEMHAAVLDRMPGCDVIIMAAAVSDFRPAHASDRKMKKEEAPAVLQLERTVDILKELGRSDGKQLLIGFAAETENVEVNARRKLNDKNIDMIVANDLLENGSGFGTDTNAVVILDRSGKTQKLPTLPKSQIAFAIVSAAAKLLKERNR